MSQPPVCPAQNEIAALGTTGAALHVSSGEHKSSPGKGPAYFHDDVDKHTGHCWKLATGGEKWLVMMWVFTVDEFMK